MKVHKISQNFFKKETNNKLYEQLKGKIGIKKNYPKSYVRNNENSVPVLFGNISQTFSLQMSKSEAEKLKGN